MLTVDVCRGVDVFSAFTRPLFHRCQRPLARVSWRMQLTHDEITRLSPDERLTLIAQLWDSLDDYQVPSAPAQLAELERRLAALDQDSAQRVTWETLKAELERRCP